MFRSKLLTTRGGKRKRSEDPVSPPYAIDDPQLCHMTAEYKTWNILSQQPNPIHVSVWFNTPVKNKERSKFLGYTVNDVDPLPTELLKDTIEHSSAYSWGYIGLTGRQEHSVMFLKKDSLVTVLQADFNEYTLSDWLSADLFQRMNSHKDWKQVLHKEVTRQDVPGYENFFKAHDKYGNNKRVDLSTFLIDLEDFKSICGRVYSAHKLLICSTEELQSNNTLKPNIDDIYTSSDDLTGLFPAIYGRPTVKSEKD